MALYLEKVDKTTYVVNRVKNWLVTLVASKVGDNEIDTALGTMLQTYNHTNIKH